MFSVSILVLYFTPDSISSWRDRFYEVATLSHSCHISSPSVAVDTSHVPRLFCLAIAAGPRSNMTRATKMRKRINSAQF